MEKDPGVSRHRFRQDDVAMLFQGLKVLSRPRVSHSAVKVDLLSTKLTGSHHQAKFTGIETEAGVSHVLGKYSTN